MNRNLQKDNEIVLRTTEHREQVFEEKRNRIGRTHIARKCARFGVAKMRHQMHSETGTKARYTQHKHIIYSTEALIMVSQKCDGK